MTIPAPITTKFNLTDELPLTCTRSGTCCHGKAVWLNPWELAQLSFAKSLTPRIFRDSYCEFGGIRLRFDAHSGNPATCSQYDVDSGCSVHTGRPLACRLYPLGRERRDTEVSYMHHGSDFPCLRECPDVIKLPYLTVADYLAHQNVKTSETAQDAALELMQQLADGAFSLLIESGLAATGDRNTLRLWHTLGTDTPQNVVSYIGSDWINLLMVPEIDKYQEDPAAFFRRHHELLETQAQAAFGELDNVAALSNASGLMMGLALHLGRGLGANPAELSEHWINTAKQLGVQ